MSKKSQKSKGNSSASHNYQSNDVVLAKLRGYPPWPAMIVDEEDIPTHVTRERPKAGKPSNTFCVRFFPVGDYSFMTGKELNLLQKHEIEAYVNEPHKKNGELLEGYKIALDPTEWLAKKKAEVESYDPTREVDELDDDAEGEGDPGKKKGTKRKRESDAKPKMRKPAGEKSKKKSGKSNENVESEEDSKPSAPKKAKKVNESDDPEVKKVRYWRNALQRIFLGKTKPKDEDMPTHNDMFKEVEAHENMTIQQLTETKIGKIMRHIANLEDDKVPRNDEFHFKSRSQALVEKWQKIAKEHEDAEAGIPSTSGQGQANGVPNGVNGTAPTTVTAEEASVAVKEMGEGANATEKDVPMTGVEVNGIPNGTEGQATDAATTGGDAMKVDAA